MHVDSFWGGWGEGPVNLTLIDEPGEDHELRISAVGIV